MNRPILMLLALLLVAADSRLPSSRWAKPIDLKDVDTLRLDITSEGSVVAAERKEPLTSVVELRNFLKDQYAARERQAGAGQVKTAVILRADRDAEVLLFQQVAYLSRQQGFPKIYVEVQQVPAGVGRIELVVPHWQQPLADMSIRALSTRDGINDGQLVAMVIQSDEGETAVPKLEALEGLLKEKRAEPTTVNKESVQINAESRLKIGPLIALLDTCHAAGFTRVALGPLPDLPAETRITAKRATPTLAAQAQAEKEIRGIYKALYAQPDAAPLAKRLAQAAAICDDAAATFVLLLEAAEAARRAGDLADSMAAMDQLAQSYRFDAWRPKLEKFRSAPANKAVVEAALQQAGAAVTKGRLDYGIRFHRLAQLAAADTLDIDLIAFVEERRQFFKLPRVDDLDPFSPVPSDIAAKPPAKLPEAKATPDEDDATAQLYQFALWYVLPGVGALILLGTLLVGWLRRGDRAVRSRLAEAQSNRFALPAGEEFEPPPDTAGPDSSNARSEIPDFRENAR